MQAEKARSKLDGICDEMANIIQPLYETDIAVFYQPSDGFVIVVDDVENNAPSNYGVKEYL